MLNFVQVAWLGLARAQLCTDTMRQLVQQRTCGTKSSFVQVDARVSTGGKLPPVVFIQNCMTVAPEHRKDPSALAAWLWD